WGEEGGDGAGGGVPPRRPARDHAVCRNVGTIGGVGAAERSPGPEAQAVKRQLTDRGVDLLESCTHSNQVLAASFARIALHDLGYDAALVHIVIAQPRQRHDRRSDVDGVAPDPAADAELAAAGADNAQPGAVDLRPVVASVPVDGGLDQPK